MGAGDASQITRAAATVGALTIPYMKGGRGRPLLFIHGLSGWSRWETFHIALALTNTVYAPCLPGWPDGEIPAAITGVADFARVMGAFLDAVDVKQADLVGHSFGGWIALELAALDPARFSKLVVLDPMGVKMTGAPAVDLAALDEEAFLRAAFVHTGVVAVRSDFGAILEDVRKGHEFENQWKSRAIIARLLNGRYADPGLQTKARAITADTLIVWGRNDALVPSRHGEALAAAIPKAQLALIPDAGHTPMRERRETTQRLVRNFLLGADFDEDAALIVKSPAPAQ